MIPSLQTAAAAQAAAGMSSRTTRLAQQRRHMDTWVGKAAPDTHWMYTVHRQPYDEYFGGQAIDEDRTWERRGLSMGMYRQLLKHRWQEAPHTPRIEQKNWTFFPGDVVEIISGADVGTRGRLADVFYSAMKVKVEGARLIRAESEDPTSGQRISSFREDWVDYTEVRLIDPHIDQPADVEWMELEDPVTGVVERSRVSKATGTIVPVPEEEVKKNAESAGDGFKDTPVDIAELKTLEGGNIAGEVNQMALVKLKALENWFVGELKKLHTKDKVLRDGLAAEKKEFQYNTYQLALQKVYERVEQEEPWLLDEVAGLRIASRPPAGKMPDFTAEQELYRELRRGARFQLKHDRRPTDVESLYSRWARTTQRGVKLMLSKEVRDRFESAAMSIKARQIAKSKGHYKISKTFKMKPLEYIQEALEIESTMREQWEIGQGDQHQKDTYIGWKPAVEKRRDELDTFDNRFGHMSGVMAEMHASQHDDGLDSAAHDLPEAGSSTGEEPEGPTP